MTLKQTALYNTHISLGARISPFAGWEMPVQYTSILDEARAVRAHAGLFDVSHMGRLEITGPGAEGFLNRVLSFNVSSLRIGRGRYGVVCNEQGGIIDDCIAYRLGPQRFLLVPNATNTQAVLEWISRWLPQADGARISDVTSSTAMIALQGPHAAGILSGITEHSLSSTRFFSATEAEVAGFKALVAHTGYTGEDGFELVLPQESVTQVWDLLVCRGATPSGLGARDVLRLEAGLLLHGNDIDVSTNPYEAGLKKFVDADRNEYVAGEALRRIRDQGLSRTLVGFTMLGRGVARHGHPIMCSSRQVGHVTSGGYSPALDMNLGLGYVPTGLITPGSRFLVDIRGRLVEAEVTTLPFYSRRRNT